MGIVDRDTCDRIEKVIIAAGLPTRAPGLNKKKVMRAMRQDKKVQGGKIRFVLLKSIGEAFIAENVDPGLVEEVLADG
jgi:3-dehydroquinate synthase